MGTPSHQGDGEDVPNPVVYVKTAKEAAMAAKARMILTAASYHMGVSINGGTKDLAKEKQFENMVYHSSRNHDHLGVS